MFPNPHAVLCCAVMLRGLGCLSGTKQDEEVAGQLLCALAAIGHCVVCHACALKLHAGGCSPDMASAMAGDSDDHVGGAAQAYQGEDGTVIYKQWHPHVRYRTRVLRKYCA
jgi:hypothetical protein